MTTLIAPAEVAGQYRNLALALRCQGVDCHYYTFYEHPYGYGEDIGPSKIPKVMRKLNTFGKGNGFVARILSVVGFELLRLFFFLKYFRRYDTYYFGFGLSLLRFNIDLPILKQLGRRLIVNLSHGSDMTPSYLDGALLNEDGIMPPTHWQIRETIKKRRMFSRFEKYADVIIGSPLSSSFLATEPYVDIIKLGRLCQAQFVSRPNEVTKIPNRVVPAAAPSRRRSRGLNVFHVPSHAPGKGSRVIREIMERVTRNYSSVRYIELAGVSNEEVLRQLPEADLLIDQLYSDLPLSGVGMEAFTLGVPVLVGGYGLIELRRMYPEKRFPPCILSYPDQIEKTLINLINYPEVLYKTKFNIYKFMVEVWSIERVAERYKELILGDGVEGELMHDPRQFIYHHGYGLTEVQCKKLLKGVLDTKGIRGLGIKRPELVTSILEFATSGVRLR